MCATFLFPWTAYLGKKSLDGLQVIRSRTRKVARLKRHHYLMGLEPNTKKIPQNSGKQIRIPEGM